MRLLILTQTMDQNNHVLGWFHTWVEEFAKRVDKITVICLFEGKHDLPENVEVFSLGKESWGFKLKYVSKFFYYILKKHKEYDTVFVHMNPEYTVLGGLFWKILNKKIYLWYTHRNVDLKLRIAVLFSKKVFSASKYSFQLKSKKLVVAGHGIDIKKFVCNRPKSDDVLRILTVGRITRIKNCHTLLRAAALIKEVIQKPIEVIFIGETTYKKDKKYLKELQAEVEGLGLSSNVKFLGTVPNHELYKHYCDATLSVNMTPTGGVDKVVLETMATKTPVIVANEAFREIFGEYADDLIFELENHINLSDKIMALISRPVSDEMISNLEEKVRKEYSINSLVQKLVEEM